MQLVYEHLLYPGIYADDFICKVTIFKNDEKIQSYGFYHLLLIDVCNGILFRVTTLGCTNMFDVETLNLYYAIVYLENKEIIMKYDKNEYTFKPETEKVEEVRT